MFKRVSTLLVEGIWNCCSGLVRTAVTGIRKHAPRQLLGGIWKYCSGPALVAARGTYIHAPRQLVEAILEC